MTYVWVKTDAPTYKDKQRQMCTHKHKYSSILAIQYVHNQQAPLQVPAD